LPRLQSRPVLICKTFEKRVTECNNEESSSKDHKNLRNKKCKPLIRERDKCYATVDAAFRYVNMEGCLQQLQAEAICAEEYCQDGNTQDCRDECKMARDSMEECLSSIVKSHLQNNGLYKEDVEGMK